MTSFVSLLVVILAITGMSNPLSHSDGDSSIDDATEGWMRVAYLNMADSSEKCLDGFRLYSENGVQACVHMVDQLVVQE